MNEGPKDSRTAELKNTEKQKGDETRKVNEEANERDDKILRRKNGEPERKSNREDLKEDIKRRILSERVKLKYENWSLLPTFQHHHQDLYIPLRFSPVCISHTKTP